MQRNQDDPSVPGDSDLDWVDVGEAESDGGRSYRRISLAALVVAVLMLTSAPFFAGGAMASANSFSAGDVTLNNTNAGQLQSLTVAPGGEVTYDGLENNLSTVDVTLETNTPSGWEEVTSKSVSGPGDREGSVTYDLSEVDLLSATSWDKQDFKASDGSSNSTDVELRITATLVGVDSGGGDLTVTDTATFTVTIENQEAGGHVHGSANTNGQGR